MAANGGILVYAGLGASTTFTDNNNRGVILYENDLQTAVTGSDVTIEWYSPVVTIFFQIPSATGTVNTAKIDFEA